MISYGMAYQGSKAGFVKRLMKYFPNADNFYDLFGGGGSVTHAVCDLKANDYKTINYNELNPFVFNLFKDAKDGLYNYDKFSPRWISGAEFILKIRQKDPIYSYMYSFASANTRYRYNKALSCFIKSIHNAIIFNDFDLTAKHVLGINNFDENITKRDRRLFYRKQCYNISDAYIADLFNFSYVHSPKSLQNKIASISKKKACMLELAHLEALERVQNISAINSKNLFMTNLSYKQVHIKPNSFVYIDPPYKGTAGYERKQGITKFNTEDLLDWASKLNEPVIISEYNLSRSSFRCIATFNKCANINTTKTSGSPKTERIYANDLAIKALKL